MAEGGTELVVGLQENDTLGLDHTRMIKKWQHWEQNLVEQREEIMALESIYEETENFRVMDMPNEEEGLFSVEIDVSALVPQSGVTVEAWIPNESEASSHQMAAHVPGPAKPRFERSESGRHLYSTIEVNHLKPLGLYLILPKTYPSDGPPILSLSSMWLDAGQLTVLCRQLDAMWTDMSGMPVIYSWIDWLQTNTLSHFNIGKTVRLTPYLEGDDEMLGPRDARALPECSDVFDGIVDLLRYDCQKEWEKFRQSVHECGVCFMEYPGSQFYILHECNHHVCHECMTEYCNMHVSEGTVQQLLCPDQECDVSIPPHIVQDVLGDEAFSRWERLLLQKTLETMKDIAWCPRCNQPVISDPDANLKLSYCTNCTFSFCTQCRESWHQRSPCPFLVDKIQKLEAELKPNTGKKGAPKEHPDDPAFEARTRKLVAMKKELMSKMCIRKTTKPCPRCKIPIEKNGGCNKVSCTKCGTSLCWVCGTKIDGYGHFNDGNCSMIQVPLENRRVCNRPTPEGARQVREAMQMGIGNIMQCPLCRQRCLRAANNNHIRCWSCRSNLCFQCKSKISGVMTTHYQIGMPCTQHSH